MKKIKCVILGYGDRSSRYSEYALLNPNELEIVAVIDINELKLKQAKQKFNLPDSVLYKNLDLFLKDNIECDVVINGTMDQLHYDTTMALLEKGYNILLEKPVTSDAEQLLDIKRKAEEKGCKVVVCHVLRYTPFYSSIKKLIDLGEIGKITDIQMNEHVWHGHFVNSYVRGKWRSEKECGSGLLLAKSCHDTDLMCWLNNCTYPTEVASFGSRSFFCPENAPEGSTEYCFDCHCKDKCFFDAYKFELEMDAIPQYTWAELNLPEEELTKEEKKEFLKKSVFGKCVYKTDMDIVDRQCVAVNFANGSVGTLNVVGGTTKAGRHIHIICEYGEILGYIEKNKIIYRKLKREEVKNKYVCDEQFYTDEVIEVGKEFAGASNAVSGHYGGDYLIMKDLVRYLNGESTSAATTVISDSVNGHLVVYAAELSRKNSTVVKIKDLI